MKNSEFDASDVGVSNGQFFGFPFDYNESEIVLIPVPWDVTTSFRPGTSKGPEAMIESSVQLDFYHELLKSNELPLTFTDQIDPELPNSNARNRMIAENIIAHLEGKITLDDNQFESFLKEVNDASDALNELVKNKSSKFLSDNKAIGIVGGEHSVPFGLINALSEKHEDFGILQFDAHADLRVAYEGFEHSHASIMNNALKTNSVSRLVQLGIRDFSINEMNYDDSRIVRYSDSMISKNLFKGGNWDQICTNIINDLPDKVYISFDIDGLSPDNCPNTGTPVPGGLSYNMAVYLLQKLASSGKQIIGFDLCEVSPGDTEIDVITGSRILWELCVATHVSNRTS